MMVPLQVMYYAWQLMMEMDQAIFTLQNIVLPRADILLSIYRIYILMYYEQPTEDQGDRQGRKKCWTSLKR